MLYPRVMGKWTLGNMKRNLYGDAFIYLFQNMDKLLIT